MTQTAQAPDDALIIRHVKLCECGQVAGHNTICPSNVLERKWVSEEADERRDRSDARKQRISNTRRATRSRLSDWQLVEEAREGEILLSTVGAAQVGSSPHGAEIAGGRAIPISTQRLDDDPRWRLAKRQLRRAAEQLLDLGDEIRGHGVAATATIMLGEHKDAEILACVGLKPREVVQHLGREVAGGTRTVERVREADGDCRWCGRDWPNG